MMRPDLHMHSTMSDGVLSPEQLVDEAARAGVTHMALTDHDTFAGSDALRHVETAIPVIPGVELSMKDMHGLHLLGYGLGAAPELRETVRGLADKRVERAGQILERLEKLGMPLEQEALEKKYRGTVGRLHIARAMVHEGYVRSMQEAFELYLGHDKPAYVAGERMSMEEAIPLLRRNGFVPVLAHPCELQQPDEMLTPLLEKWKDMGLMGVEVYHPSARSHGFEGLCRMARRMKLLVTGGSDFHQDSSDHHGSIGSMSVYWRSAEEDMDALMEAMTSGMERVTGRIAHQRVEKL